jgi:hypothetical protein
MNYRPLKFRQRFRDQNTMHYWGFIDGVFINPYVNLPSEQFTGLLDKDGNSIYEGDFIRGEMYRRSTESIHPDHYYNDIIAGVVRFEFGNFLVERKDNGKYELLSDLSNLTITENKNGD